MGNFTVGEWRVFPDQRRIERPAGVKRLQPKVMEVLAYLADHPNEVVSRDQLISSVWAGRVVTDEVLSRSISLLRSALGDDRANPVYVETIAKSGYRLIADVGAVPGEIKRGIGLPGIAALTLLLITVVWLVSLIFPDTKPNFQPPENSVAVLPFVNMSADNDYFSDGITEEILNILAQDPNLLVVARTSSFVFKNKPEDIRQVGRRLNVAHIVEGSVRASEDRIRITAQLIETTDGTHLWSEKYDYPLEDIFQIQDEIALSVAKQMSGVVRDTNRIRYEPENLEAYDAFLLGRDRLQNRTVASLREAVGFFKEAIDHDSNYPLAYVGLADAYALLHEYGDFLTAEEMLARAQPLLTKAIVLDPQLGEAYASLGGLHRLGDNYEDAEQAFHRAIELSPNYPTTYQWYGYLLSIQLGRAEEGLVQLRKAKELDPISAIINKNLADALVAAGKFDQGIEQFRKVIEIDPKFPGSYQNLAATYRSAFGDLNQSIEWLKKAIALDGQNPAYPSTLSQTYLDLDELDQAKFWRDRALEVAASASLDPLPAVMYLGLYQKDDPAALNAANDILRINPRSHQALQVLRIVDPGNHDATFQRITKAYGYLLNSSEPLTLADHNVAVELAYMLRLKGDVDRALPLEDRILAFTKDRPRLGFGGFGISDVRVYLMRENTTLAMAALNDAISQGLRTRTWLFMRDPIFDPLQNLPEYKTLMAQLRGDLDQMRSAVLVR